MKANEWYAEITNDPRHGDARLYIEIMKGEAYVARIDRVGVDLVLTVYEAGVGIPATWLTELLSAAEKDLPTNLP